MKMNKKAVIAATVFSAALNLSACAYGPPYDPADNRNAGVYGPPPSQEREYEENTSGNTGLENDNMEETPENE